MLESLGEWMGFPMYYAYGGQRRRRAAALWQHPQLLARGRFRDVQSPAGALRAMLPPGVNSSFQPRMDPVPAVGQHSAAILRELGRDEAGIARPRAAGAI